LNIELESDVIVKQQFVVCEDGLFNRFNGLLGYDFMENYDVILRPKESVMYIGDHEIPLMSESDLCQEYCIIGSRIERRVDENSCGKVNGEERRGKGVVTLPPRQVKPSPQVKKGGEAYKRLPYPWPVVPIKK